MAPKRECAAGISDRGFLPSAGGRARSRTGRGKLLFFGPVYDTPSKRTFGPAQGIARLSEVCRAVRIPVIAIGGLTEENAPEALKAGAAGIAAIRLFQEAKDGASLKESVERLHRISLEAIARR